MPREIPAANRKDKKIQKSISLPPFRQPMTRNSFTSPAPTAPIQNGIQQIRSGISIPQKNPAHPNDEHCRILSSRPAATPARTHRFGILPERKSVTTAVIRTATETPKEIWPPIRITSSCFKVIRIINHIRRFVYIKFLRRFSCCALFTITEEKVCHTKPASRRIQGFRMSKH